MRAGYEIQNSIIKKAIFIFVANYPGTNTVVNLGIENIEALKSLKYSHDIGFWRIKPKKSVGKK